MEQTKHTPEWIMDRSLIYSLMETSWHTGRPVMTNEYWFQVYAHGRDEAKEIAITKQIFELITGETAAERDRLKEDCDKLIAGNAKLRGQLSSNADQFAYVASQRDQLKEENERLKDDVAHAGKVHSKLNGDLMRLNDLNRELLEALKEMYMFEYGGNSVTIEDAIGRAPKSLIRKNDFEQKIISLIQKAS